MAEFQRCRPRPVGAQWTPHPEDEVGQPVEIGPFRIQEENIALLLWLQDIELAFGLHHTSQLFTDICPKIGDPGTTCLDVTDEQIRIQHQLVFPL
jgi:hypothetical protein